MNEQRGAGDGQQRVIDGELVVVPLSVDPTATACKQQVTSRWRMCSLILTEPLKQRRQRVSFSNFLDKHGRVKPIGLLSAASAFWHWRDAVSPSSGGDGRTSAAELFRDGTITDLGVALCEPVAVVKLGSHRAEARTYPRR